jgi:hypothetical protein
MVCLPAIQAVSRANGPAQKAAIKMGLEAEEDRTKAKDSPMSLKVIIAADAAGLL